MMTFFSHLLKQKSNELIILYFVIKLNQDKESKYENR